MDEPGEADAITKVYRALIVGFCFLELGVAVYLLADSLSDGDLHRWVDARQAAFKKSVSEARARARVERETRRQANYAVFEAMMILEEARND